MSKFSPNLATTGIGSLPFTDPKEAVDFVLETCPQIPYWPQLPKRTQKESMIYQFAVGLPGLNAEKGVIDTTSPVFAAELEEYLSVIASEAKQSPFAIEKEYAAGLYKFTSVIASEAKQSQILAVKGHITGPVSFGLSITDENKKHIIYNDILREIYVKHLCEKVRFMEDMMSKCGKPTIIFADEPLLYSYGSAYFNFPRDEIVSMLKEVLSSIKGLKGIHACHNCDWSILYEVEPDIISFDAYSYLDKFMIYKNELEEFIQRGGVIAWGIVPTTDEMYKKETAESLVKIMKNLLDALSKDGFDVSKLLEQSIITPADGVGTLSVDDAKLVFNLNTQISSHLSPTAYRLPPTAYRLPPNIYR